MLVVPEGMASLFLRQIANLFFQGTWFGREQQARRAPVVQPLRVSFATFWRPVSKGP